MVLYYLCIILEINSILQIIAGSLYHLGKSSGLLSRQQCWQVFSRFKFKSFLIIKLIENLNLTFF